MKFKNERELQDMSSDEIRLEMLNLWHEVDFNNLSEEESNDAIDALKVYRDVLHERQYEYRYYG